MKRGILLLVAAAGALAAIAYAALRDPKPDTPQGIWEPVDHTPPA